MLGYFKINFLFFFQPLGSLITNGPYVVREEFLYDAIVGKETLEPEDYAFE